MTLSAVPILSLLLVLSLAALAWTNRNRLRPRRTDGEALRQDIAGAIALGHSGGAVEKEDRDRLLGALDLHDRTVEEIMRHRRQIEMVDADLSPDRILTQVLASPYTRLPVFRDSDDTILGVIHAKDLLREVDRLLRGPDAAPGGLAARLAGIPLVWSLGYAAAPTEQLTVRRNIAPFGALQFGGFK